MKRIFTLFSAVLFGITVNAQIIVLQPDAASGVDTYVSSVNDSDNYGTDAYLYVGGGEWESDTFNLYLKFDLSSVTPGTTVTSARVDLYEMGQNGSTQGYDYGVYEVTGPWAEDTLYWYNQPERDTAMLYGFTGDYIQWSGGPGWRSVYIPDTVVQNWVDNPAENFGIVIKAIAGFYGYPYIPSSDWANAEYRPRIILNSDGSKISGVVTDAVSGTPLAGVIMKAYDFNNVLLIDEDTTDLSGNYLLDVLYPDTFKVRINAVNGYLGTTIDSIVVAEGQDFSLDPMLAPDAHAVAGIQNGVWTEANSPYILSGDVIVRDSAQLIIEQGVVVQFAGPYMLGVYGCLKAIGTASDSIKFTNYDTIAGNKGRGLRFYEADSSVVEFCLIENMYSYDNIWGELEYDRGGGFYVDRSNLKIIHNTIRRNFAQQGGGLYLINYQGAVVSVERNKIEENIAQYNGCSNDGGAGAHIVAADNYESVFFNENLILNNEFIDGNMANIEGGGGLYVTCGNFRINNNTFLYNKAFRGPAIYILGFKGKIINNIFWFNSGSVNNEQVAIETGGTDSLFEASYNCIQDTGIIYQDYSIVSTDTVPGMGNIYTYPGFADTLAQHYWLAPNSPCIDTGYNQLLFSQFDFIDRCRVFDGDYDGSGIVDMGAYEYNAVDMPYLDLGEDYSVCPDPGNIISASEFYYQYIWSTGDTLYYTSVDSSDLYAVTVSNFQGCYAFDSVAIGFYPVPDIILPDTAIPLSNGTVTLDAGTGYADYSWSSGDTTHEIVVFGNYLGVGTHTIYVTVTSQDGCVDTAEATITVYDDASVSEYANSSVLVYPNPAENSVSISGMDENEENEILISDVCGKLVVKRNITAATDEIEVSQLSPGVYFLRITNNSGISYARIIKK